MDSETAGGWPEKAERIVSAEQVSAAMDQQARRLEAMLPVDEAVTVVALMNGGMYPRRVDTPYLPSASIRICARHPLSRAKDRERDRLGVHAGLRATARSRLAHR